jgi:hypothetical protein
MKHVPDTNDIYLHTLKVKTDHLEFVGDDGQYVVFSAIDNGQYSSDKSQFEARLNEDNATPKALQYGGFVAWTNLQPEVARRAMLIGLEWLSRTNQLTPDMFVEGGLDGSRVD